MSENSLYWKDILLGAVRPTEVDQPWFNGEFIPTQWAEDLRTFFNFMVDEDESRDPSDVFDETLMDPENWSLVDDSGRVQGIEMPAVYWEDRSISWRSR